MNDLEKIEIEPLQQGFTKVDGKSIEDVLQILQDRGIDKILCYLNNLHDFRNHVVILTQSDYEILMRDHSFEFAMPAGLSSSGLYAKARYEPQDYKSVKERWIFSGGYVIEQTQLRPCSLNVSPQDAKFLEVNKISLAEAWNPIHNS